MVKRIIMVVISLIFFSSAGYPGGIYIGVTSVLKHNIEKLRNTVTHFWISMVDGRWECLPDGKGSTGTVTLTADSLIISYNLVNNGWVNVRKLTKLDLRKHRKVKFSYRGSGNANTLELKLVDADNTNFGRKWLRSTNTDWKEV